MRRSKRIRDHRTLFIRLTIMVPTWGEKYLCGIRIVRVWNIPGYATCGMEIVHVWNIACGILRWFVCGILPVEYAPVEWKSFTCGISRVEY